MFACLVIVSNYQLAVNSRPFSRLNNRLFKKVGTMENFEAEKIKPDIMDDIPAQKLSVIYPSKAIVGLGNELKPTQVKDEPTYSFKAEPDQLYTLLFIDPDAPSRKEPTYRNIIHQMIHNIKGSDISQGDAYKGDVAVEYVGSGPPLGTGKHRYVFLLYKQADGKRIEIQEKIKNDTRKGRMQFDLRKYTAEHNLGKPVAGNFYLAEYDDYVPNIHAQLSKN